MRRKPIGQDNIPLQPRLPDGKYIYYLHAEIRTFMCICVLCMVHMWTFIAADVNKLLHDDELLDQNIQMPWWDPNYVKDEHEVSFFRAFVNNCTIYGLPIISKYHLYNIPHLNVIPRKCMSN